MISFLENWLTFPRTTSVPALLGHHCKRRPRASSSTTLTFWPKKVTCIGLRRWSATTMVPRHLDRLFLRYKKYKQTCMVGCDSMRYRRRWCWWTSTALWMVRAWWLVVLIRVRKVKLTTKGTAWEGLWMGISFWLKSIFAVGSSVVLGTMRVISYPG